MYHKNYFWIYTIFCTFIHCNNPKNKKKQTKNNNDIKIEASNMDVYYYEGTTLKYIIQTPKLIELKNGDRQYPEGILFKVYENDQLLTTLQSAHAVQYKVAGILEASQNVSIENTSTQQKLYTQSIILDQKKEQIYTDQPVKIIRNEEILTGKGLQADKDFTQYTILQPTGTLDIAE